jgi:hypothetical protein
MSACRLVGLASGVAPDQWRLKGPMIGREAELGVMLSLFNDVVASGQPRLMTVVGSAGVGKTRLVGEGVAAMVARHPDAVVLRGRCLSAGRGITYWALGEMLREACGVSLADPLATAQMLGRPSLDPRPAGVAWRYGRHGVRARRYLRGQPARKPARRA